MIPITKPFLGKEEILAAREVLHSGWVTQGPKVREFEEAFAKFTGAKYACATSNCTTALHLALKAVGVVPGNIVITPSHSFIATANAVRCCQAEPVFVDIDEKDFNLSPRKLKNFLDSQCEKKGAFLYFRKKTELTSPESPLEYVDHSRESFGRVAAILTVHQMGMPCDLDAILELAARYHLPVVEDAACAIGSEYRGSDEIFEKIGRPRGDAACFSFHPRKILTTGDGGMLTTNHSAYNEKFHLWRQHGMSISAEARHISKMVQIEEYPVTGYNYRMTDIQAAMGIEQLKKLPAIIERRRAIDKKYRAALTDIPWIQPPLESPQVRSNWQSYPVRILNNAPRPRNAIMQYLLQNGIATRPGIMNAHQEKPYANSLWHLPTSERAREDVMLLPFFTQMEMTDIQTITKVLRKL